MLVPENQWYPVLESRELGRKPLAAERFAQNWVFWRISSGEARAHPDRCPHLGAALSAGKIVGGELVCPFHGFAFDAAGQCTLIPANGRKGRIPKGMALQTPPLREAYGLIWLWRGEARDAYPELPYFPILDSGWRTGTITAEWPVHYTRAIENQLDVAHLTFVHRTTIGAGGRSFVSGPYVEADRLGVRVWVSNAHDEGQRPRPLSELKAEAAGRQPSLDFRFPGVWLLNISPRLKNFIAFVPVNEQRTRFYLRVCHTIRNPLLAWPFEKLMGLSNRFILNQDRRVVVTQTPANSAQARGDRLIEADRAIAQFRHLHASLLERGAGDGA